MATLVNQLFGTYHINTLGFDVAFAEKDESSDLKNLERMQQQYLKDDAVFAKALKIVKPRLNFDQIFADSLKNRKVVLGYYFQTNGDTNHIGQLPPASFSEKDCTNQSIAFTEASGFGANLPVLQQNSLAAGHFNPEPDADGITRKIAVLIKYGDHCYDSLATAVTRIYLQNQALKAKFAKIGADEDYAGLESFQLAGKRILVDNEVATLIPYRGMQGSFQYVSATDVLNNK